MESTNSQRTVDPAVSYRQQRAAYIAWATIRANEISRRQQAAAYIAWATIRSNKRSERSRRSWVTRRANAVAA